MKLHVAWLEQPGCVDGGGWALFTANGHLFAALAQKGRYPTAKNNAAAVCYAFNKSNLPITQGPHPTTRYSVMVPPFEKDLIVGSVLKAPEGWYFNPHVDGRKRTRVPKDHAHLAVPRWVGEFKLV